MAREWMSPIGGVMVQEDGTEAWMSPIGGFQFQEDQAAAAGTNRLLMINPPGLDGGFGTGLSL